MAAFDALGPISRAAMFHRQSPATTTYCVELLAGSGETSAAGTAEAAAKPTSWELPYKNPAGLAFDAGRLWIADWFTQSFYLHNPQTLAVERVIHFTKDTPVALTFGSDAAWSVISGLAQGQETGEFGDRLVGERNAPLLQ